MSEPLVVDLTLEKSLHAMYFTLRLLGNNETYGILNSEKWNSESEN